jgi:phage shock protein A
VTTEVRIEDIQATLSKWARSEAALKDRVRLLENRVEELSLEIRHAVEQGQDAFELPRNPAMTMRLVIEEAVLAVQARGTEQVRTIAGQKDQIDHQASRIAGMEEEIRESIESIVTEMELPPNRHRTLRNAVHDACGMVVEAKKIIQENL